MSWMNEKKNQKFIHLNESIDDSVWEINLFGQQYHICEKYPNPSLDKTMFDLSLLYVENRLYHEICPLQCLDTSVYCFTGYLVNQKRRHIVDGRIAEYLIKYQDEEDPITFLGSNECIRFPNKIIYFPGLVLEEPKYKNPIVPAIKYDPNKQIWEFFLLPFDHDINPSNISIAVINYPLKERPSLENSYYHEEW